MPADHPAQKRRRATNAIVPDAGPFMVRNAGLVLVAPFLPELFDVAGVASNPGRAGRWCADRASQARAAHVLQYLVGGPGAERDADLTLNKVLCGMPHSAHAGHGFAITEREAASCDELLQTLTSTWPQARALLAAGFRKAFLLREGRLALLGRSWSLSVTRLKIDSLLDTLPWSFGDVHHPWMGRSLRVSW